MPHSKFAHLHLHTQYSLLDGACKIPDLIQRAQDLKMPAVAMTDHGNMFGAIDFYTRAMDGGIKPIIGYEAYLAPTDRFEKSSHGISEAAYHLTLLARDEEGYKNLMKLATIGYLEGFYYRPRIDKAVLAEHSRGLIGLSGCLKGELAWLILNNRSDEAKKLIDDFKNIFGPENFYLELQDQLLPEQKKLNSELLRLAKALSLKVVATNDVHYLHRKDAPAHEILLCIQTQTTLDDPNRLKFRTDEFYLKSEEEMAKIFCEVPEAISNTLRIAERCNLELDFTRTYLPSYVPPEGKTREVFLSELCEEGLKNRYGGVNDALRLRLDHEVKVINQTGYTSYFLIVWDFVHFAKKNGISVGPGRGSAAGSLVAYCLGVTDIDPIRHGLIFERFLNPDRVSPPDIDIDFCFERRGEVIDYVAKKYGQANVAQIITFGTMAARAVIRDVGRVMGIPYAEVDRIAKLIPPELNITLASALEAEPELKTLYRDDQRITKLLDTCQSLEGLSRNASTHAAGVVISDRDLSEYTPIFKTEDGQITTQYPMGALEKIGLLKMDFLGLRTLTVIDEAKKIIQRTKGKSVEFERIPLDDPKTYELLSRAESIGVFQLESSGMRDLLKKLEPQKFEDIVALLALYRPGPLGSGMVDDFIKRKHEELFIDYDHPSLEPILKETYGIIVYQEQVMKIVNELGGFSLAQADLLRRAMSKKHPEVIEQQRNAFLKGATKNGVDPKTAKKIFNLIEHFAGYGFAKCVVGSTGLVDAETGEIVTVEELYKSGRYVVTLSCDDEMKIVKRPINKIVNNGCKPVFEVKTYSGKRIVVTDNHPFLTIDGWKELKHITVGERIATPRILPMEGQRRWEDYKLITLAGVLSEGNTCHPSGFYYYNNERDQVEDFLASLSQFEDTLPTISSRRGGRYEVYAGTGKDTKFHKGRIPWNKRLTDTDPLNCIEVGPKRSGARIWIEELGLVDKGSKDKFIPHEVFSLTLDNLALFLGRLWTGDGFLSARSNTMPYYSTSSKLLAHQVQHLLLRFGILSKIAHRAFKYKGGSKDGYQVYLLGKRSIQIFLDVISPHIIGRLKKVEALRRYYKLAPDNSESKDVIPVGIKLLVQAEKRKSSLMWREIEEGSGVCMKEFYGQIRPHKHGFRRSTIKALAQYLGSEELDKYATAQIYWDSIVSIEYVGNEETYDLEVEGTHNFIANGIIVHNSHSAAYALISYQTAYLKANYSVEFMTALLTSEKDNTDKIVAYIDEAKRMGIRVLPPDVNESFAKFTVVGDSIRFGLTAVKNVGRGAVDSIVQIRSRYGNFKSLYEFCERVSLRLVNRRVIESLIKCGAFDSLRLYRSQLMTMLDRALEIGQRIQRDRQGGQFSFFDVIEGLEPFKGDFQEVPQINEWPEAQLLSFEREILGFYITGHPLAKYERLLRIHATATSGDLSRLRDKDEVSIGGIIDRAKEVMTKKGEKMAFIDLEDLEGAVDVVVFPDTFRKASRYIKKDSVVFVKGRVQLKGESPKIVATEIIPIKEVTTSYTRAVEIELNTSGLSEGSLKRLRGIIISHLGQVPVYINFTDSDGRRLKLSAGQDMKVHPSDDFILQVEKLFGKDSVSLK